MNAITKIYISAAARWGKTDFSILHERRLKVIVFIGALAFFLGGIFLSLAAQPVSDIRLEPLLLLIFICMPLLLLFNAFEFQITARLQNGDMTLLKSLRIVIMAAAANFLPVPGSAFIRVGALKGSGINYRKGIAVTLYSSLIWVGVAFVYAGLAIVCLERLFIGWAHVVFGSLILLASFVYAMFYFKKFSLNFFLLLNRVCIVLIDAVRLFLAFSCLGFRADFAQASTLVTSGIAGAAIAIIPGGLGIREMTAAALAPIAALMPSSVFLATSFLRFTDICLIGTSAGLLGLIFFKASKRPKAI